MPGMRCSVSIEGVDTSSVHWPETYFESRAMAEPGTCQITLRGSSTTGLGSVIRFFANGLNLWTGYVMSITHATWFPDKDDVKTIIQGVDLNILFDRLIVYNHTDLFLHPDGGGMFSGEPATKKKKGTPRGAVPPDTPVDTYLNAMLKDTDLDKVQPSIRPMISVGGMWNQTGAWGLCHNAGATLRALVADSVAQVAADQQGSIVFYITPDGTLKVSSVDSGGGGVSAMRGLSSTTDISNVRTEVYVFGQKLNPDPKSKQVYFNVAHEYSTPIGDFKAQYAETLENWSMEAVVARANKIITQQSNPAKMARWQQFDLSLIVGSIASAGGVSAPVRSIRYTFPSKDSCVADVDASYDTLDPWGLILASQRPPNRGMAPPQVQYLPQQPTGTDAEGYVPPAVDPFTKVEERPLLEKKSEGIDNTGDFKLTYGYVKGSVEVFAAKGDGTTEYTKDGLAKLPRWAGVPKNPDVPLGTGDPNADQPTNQFIGYKEVDSAAGSIQIMLPPGYFETDKKTGEFRLKQKNGQDIVIIIAQYYVANIIGKKDGS